jgi:hypothetical protein
MSEGLPINCSPAIARWLLLNDVGGDRARGFWFSIQGPAFSAHIFWPLIPGAEDMVRKVVER